MQKKADIKSAKSCEGDGLKIAQILAILIKLGW